MDRRFFLKSLGLTAGAMLAAPQAQATPTGEPVEEPFAALQDITMCGICRACEEACAQAYSGEPFNLQVPDIYNEEDLEHWRDTSETQWTVLNKVVLEDGQEFGVKRQCMHCATPACASACLTRAMLKTKEGPVIWRKEKCMGCRYCMVSCPFGIPKFEYDKAIPRIQKCRFCWDLVAKGEIERPHCIDACPNEAIIFGRRSEVLEIAWDRIYKNPDDYVHHVYGEKEVGGTGWLYLSSVPFEKLGFKTDLGTIPYPEYTREFLYAVPIILTLWPTFMLGLYRATHKAEPEEEV